MKKMKEDKIATLFEQYIKSEITLKEYQEQVIKQLNKIENEWEKKK